MAKENQTVIGISRGTGLTITLVIAVMAAMMFWFDRGGSEAMADGAVNFVIQNNTTRIVKTEEGLGKLQEHFNSYKELTDKRFVATEKTNIRMEGKQDAILNGQKALQEGQRSNAQFREAMIKEMAGLSAYLKTIDTID